MGGRACPDPTGDATPPSRFSFAQPRAPANPTQPSPSLRSGDDPPPQTIKHLGQCRLLDFLGILPVDADSIAPLADNS
jgi:hypothetical protein